MKIPSRSSALLKEEGKFVSTYDAFCTIQISLPINEVFFSNKLEKLLVQDPETWVKKLGRNAN